MGIFNFCKFEFCHVPALVGVVEKQFTYKKNYNYPLVWAMAFYVGILPPSIWFLGSLRDFKWRWFRVSRNFIDLSGQRLMHTSKVGSWSRIVTITIPPLSLRKIKNKIKTKERKKVVNEWLISFKLLACWTMQCNACICIHFACISLKGVSCFLI